ncbi:MAG: CoA pyrophosphatase [Clostridium sp.]|jgi:coenzyme A diphosphatase NUDT7|nr:CoA pyrophosphatase [Clostridium sp.]
MKLHGRESEGVTTRLLKTDSEDRISRMKSLWGERRPGILDRKPGMDFSVLVPLVEKDGEFHILFEVRSSKLKSQPGEVCFPGGAVEAGESRRQAAVREAVEELLTDESRMEVLAPLDVLITPSGQMVHPFLAVLRGYQGCFSEDEVERVFTAPLAWFAAREPEVYITDVVTEPGADFPFELVPGGRAYRWRKGEYRVLFYRHEEAVIWGMTAKILHSFILMCREAEGRLCLCDPLLPKKAD